MPSVDPSAAPAAEAAQPAVQPEGSPTAPAAAPATPYEWVGGEAAVRRLVDRFYDLMDLEARYAQLRSIHPSTLEGSRDKLFWFLCGWLGGPDYFVERFGHPRLRARHLPYAVGPVERDQWMACMVQAMTECELDETLRLRLTESFANTADWMVNQPHTRKLP
ncbi:group II truncated hemoglobin [Roseateles amylovorans]|uniref:Group II truncated hemoglobin n=1 Tax=Roseateles amylovorans TaxID=2978473 RepID=A0ABY6AVJ7_9BURK|nr:group II truncated hemoglobin [Roseateles amylovorans]UXH76958.1 group II truncated hemoglobin [Roseateles amylovorans]